MTQTISRPAPPTNRISDWDDDDDDLLTAEHETPYGGTFVIQFLRSEKPQALRYAYSLLREIGICSVVQLSARIREASGEVCVAGKGWVEG